MDACPDTIVFHVKHCKAVRETRSNANAKSGVSHLSSLDCGSQGAVGLATGWYAWASQSINKCSSCCEDLSVSLTWSVDEDHKLMVES